MTLRRIMSGIYPHEESAHCVRNGCVPADTVSPAPDTRLARLGEALDYYERFFGVDPAALPAVEARGALEQLAQCVQAARSVVAGYPGLLSGLPPARYHFTTLIDALAAVLGKENTL